MPLHIYDRAFWICFSGFLRDTGSYSFYGPCQNSLLKNVKFPRGYTTDSNSRRSRWRNRVWWNEGGEAWQSARSQGKTWQKQEDSCGWKLRGKRVRESVADGLKTNANIDLWYNFYLLSLFSRVIISSTSSCERSLQSCNHKLSHSTFSLCS